MAYSEVSDDKAKALFNEECGICHALEYATDMRDTPEGWRSTVVRMIEDNGADLNEEKTEAIINYLNKFYGK
jgi:nitrate/TMAO reductase-like tetraheme cytochrome c subunit